jgi:hypothetical protein
MRTYSVQVFDDVVQTPGGSAGPWYSEAEHQGLLGTADALAVGAVVQYLSGASVTVTVTLEHSGDGRNWFTHPQGSVVIDSLASADGILAGYVNDTNAFLPYVRFKFAISAAGAVECRIRLYVTGRTVGRARAAAHKAMAM